MGSNLPQVDSLFVSLVQCITVARSIDQLIITNCTTKWSAKYIGRLGTQYALSFAERCIFQIPREDARSYLAWPFNFKANKNSNSVLWPAFRQWVPIGLRRSSKFELNLLAFSLRRGPLIVWGNTRNRYSSLQVGIKWRGQSRTCLCKLTAL